MNGNGGAGDAHARGDFLTGETFDARKFDRLALARRQFFERILQAHQFLPRGDGAIR